MSKAYLTIDDGPTKNTRAFIDFLISKNITPIMFFYGEQICKERENGIYAIQKGAVIGNHSYTHPHFSELNLDECISEIECQEDQIDLLYKDAGVTRKYKLFRFPFGDKGGKNKNALQKYLEENKFSRIDDTQIKYDWYNENRLNKDYDIFWTFDFREYELENDNSFTYNNILNLINDDKPIIGGALLEPNAYNIVLIHDHEKTEEVYPNYFPKIINYVLDRGVEFIKPKFITPITGIKFERATVDDAETLINVRNQCFYEDYIKYGECPGYNISKEHMRDSISKMIAYKIICENKVVGNISVRDNHDNTYYIGCLCIIPDYQNKGIGQEAINFIESKLTNAVLWTLQTPADKKRNHYFYKKMGYSIVSECVEGSVKLVLFEKKIN